METDGERHRDGARILVVGASGLVGSALLRHFGAQATGTCNQHPAAGLLPLDITDANATRRLLVRLRPAIVVHTAALTHVDLCEKEPARSEAVNVHGTRNVAEAAAAVDARYLFFSTDYVFGGDRGPHRLAEPFEPLSVYGRHKLEAEGIVAAAVANHVIVRSCNLYGYQPGGKNFVLAVYECGMSGRAMRVPVDQWGSPTLAEDLATATAALIQSDVVGAAHLAGPDYLDRLDLARRAARAFDLDADFIEGVPTVELNQAAPRPLKGGLDATETAARLGFRFSSLADGLGRMRSAMERAGLPFPPKRAR